MSETALFADAMTCHAGAAYLPPAREAGFAARLVEIYRNAAPEGDPEWDGATTEPGETAAPEGDPEWDGATTEPDGGKSAETGAA